jgi:phage tail-like protein
VAKALEEPSSWLAHLPPVLWAEDPDAPPEVALGAVLKVFEKLLTGIEDGVPLPHRVQGVDGAALEHDHVAITAEVARLHRLFDPWTTPERFLPWLASWVGLRFPAVQGTELWDEYQRRRATAQIGRIHRLRGRRSGLAAHVELVAVGPTRPRVALDDGARLIEVVPRPDRPAAVTGLVLHGPVVTSHGVRVEGLCRPWTAATASDGSVLVGDTGLPVGLPVQVPNRVWHLGPAGDPDLAGAPPRPRPVAPESLVLSRVVAVAVRPARGGASETLYVLDRPGKLWAVPAPFATSPAGLVTSLARPGIPFWPVAMAVDAAGDLLVLDRGEGSDVAVPHLVTVQPDPLAVTRTPLRRVVEPLSLLVEADGTLLVGDGGVQFQPSPAQRSGDLVRVDRSTTPWTETPLLPAGSPLVAPTGLARTSDGRLHVLDAGLKPFTPSVTDPFIGSVAEHAAVLTADLATSPPSLVRVSAPSSFTYPSGMTAVGDRLVVCDPGQPEAGGVQPYWSRVRPFQLDVVVHFAEDRLPADPDERRRAMHRTVGDVLAVVDEQKPAHVVRNLITAI